MTPPELEVAPRWCRTGDACFPVVARVDGSWWVLRLNAFPHHPLWTLFVDGEHRVDVDDAPPPWGDPAGVHPVLDADDVADALGPVRHLVAYGSETGDPCDDPYCCG